MRERPIIFSGPMVRAILGGTKTQTRRVVRGQPLEWLLEGFTAGYVGDPRNMLCPYGGPGDRLWVREAWAIAAGAKPESRAGWQWQGWPLWYAADGVVRFTGALEGGPAFMTREDRWRPSIFMPRWASRLTLEIADVRVERLHEITEADILAEGVTVPLVAEMTGLPWSDIPDLHAAWRTGWDMINGKRAPWSSNQWVWAITFRRVEG